MTVRVFTTDGSAYTIDSGTDWEIDNDGTLVIIDEALEQLGIFNRDVWIHAQRGKLAEAK